MIETSLIRLRPPLSEDLDLLISLRNDLDLQTSLMSLPRANTDRKVKDWLHERLTNPEIIFFTIAELSNNKACGYIQINNIDFINRFGELGICLHSSCRGKYYGRDSILSIEQYVKEIFNIKKIVLKVLEKNNIAIALYEKLTYRKIGVYYEHFYNKDRWHNVVAMEKILR